MDTHGLGEWDEVCRGAEAPATFAETHDFARLYRSYEWYEDTWQAGFPRMLELEERLSTAAKENRVFYEHLVAVAEWGRKRGSSVESDDEISLSLYVDGELDPAVRERPEALLLELDQQVKYFGPTYLSKVLMFAAPEHYGAIDTRLVTVFGRDGYGWLDLYVRDYGSGPHIPDTQAGWPSEFGKWIKMLRAFARHLNATGVECPHPDAYVRRNLRSGGEWSCADVETALFSYASQQMGIERSRGASHCGPQNQGTSERTMRELETWAGRSRFRYEGSVEQGTIVHFGTGFAHTARLSAEQFRRLLAHFKGRTVPIGTSRDSAPGGSVGAWLQENVTPTAIASYVGPILLDEGYAEKVGRSDIRFK